MPNTRASGGVFDAVDHGGLAVAFPLAGDHGGVFLAFAELVVDPPPRHVHQPRLERSLIRIVELLLALLGDRQNRFLHTIKRLILPQPGLDRH